MLPECVAEHLRPNPRASYGAAMEDIRQHQRPEMKKLERTGSLQDG